MEFHEIANLFPMMGVDEFEQLKEDIKQNGLIEPIVLYEDKILDGRNRWLACGEVGEKPRFNYYDGDQPVSFVISKNLHRRHLNKSQVGMIGVEAKQKLAIEARKRMFTGVNQHSSPTALMQEGEKGEAAELAAKV